MAQTHLMETLFEWAWLMNLNPTRISKTPRPSITDEWASTTSRDLSTRRTLMKAKISIGMTECSTQAADSGQEQPVSHGAGTCCDYMGTTATPKQINSDIGNKSLDNEEDGTTERKDLEQTRSTDLHNVLESLVTKDRSPAQPDPIKRWPIAYQEEMQLHALDALTACGSVLLEDIIRLDGPNRLIMFLSWCDGADSFTGQGNSFHGEGGRHNKRAQLRYALRLIRSLLDTGDERITEWYPRDQCSHLLGCLVDLTENPKCFPYLMSWSGVRCLNPDESQQNPVGLDAVAQLLSKAPDMAASAALNKMIDAATAPSRLESSCTRTDEKIVVEQSKESAQTKHSLINEDALNWSPVGCGPTLIELLCSLWRSEQTQLTRGATTSLVSSSGLSSSASVKPDSPLNSYQTSNSSRPTDTDQSDGMRVNIYALLLRLGFSGDDNLSVDNKITLKEIEAYFDRKNAEVWAEIDQELQRDGVRPITPDKEMLRRIRVWNRKQQEQQSKKLSRSYVMLPRMRQRNVSKWNTIDLIVEVEVATASLLDPYATKSSEGWRKNIREVQRYRHQLELEFSDYLSRTSNPVHLSKARVRQRSAIRASRIRPTRTAEPGRRPFSPTPPTTHTTVTTTTAVGTTTTSNTEEDYGVQSSDSAVTDALGSTMTTTTTTNMTKEEKSDGHSFDSSTGDGRGSCSTEATYIGSLETKYKHPIEVKNTNVTAFCAQTVFVESTPHALFTNPTDLEKEIMKVIPIN
ncbi:hypothetical protein FGIG_02010 [Fasciola gigantica]|uniref:Cilia- and flagella-associated protein 69 ARM repeats domain-containing protein n=1 Tax=Fasciola gigantica TaxID=46835 RepID=A0A504Z2L2_FASGI|nr:hypothetical protein FGIG_02010 [Fasciola gigantica]